ncbi:MAG: hypothetical protein GX245_01390 [Eubacteriaceae bacterium]|jgi:YbbR domain-containing protein|nr:hypothetical protein [Eubacteriaceae bacterium]
MKKKKNKILYFVFALVIAVLLWMIALNEENPMATRNMLNVPVNIYGQQILASQDLVALNKQNTVNLKLKGPVLTVSTITPKDLNVYADASAIVRTGEYMLPVVISGLPYGVEVAEIGPTNITVEIEKLTEIEMPVTVGSLGSLPNDLSVFSLTPSVSNVRIKGPESVVKTVAKVEATAEIGEVTHDTTQSRPLIAYTKEGTKVTDVTIDEANIDVEILLGHKKTAQVALTIQGKPADGYAVTAIEAEPKTVEIITRTQEVNNVSAVVSLSGNETADTTLIAAYNVDDAMIKVINAPVIRAVLKITPI